MIAKKDLKDMVCYSGKCRNAYVAEWHEKENCFIHLRTKFGSTFAEKINHPEDDNGFDTFIPLVEIESHDWIEVKRMREAFRKSKGIENPKKS